MAQRKRKHTIPEFGERLPELDYEPRPSVYGVALRKSDQVLVVAAPLKLILPGGGIEPGESEKQALYREVREEAGWTCRTLRHLGHANEWVVSARKNRAYHKQGSFYLIELLEPLDGPLEADHEAYWMDHKTARMNLQRGFYRWAVEQAIR